MRFLCLNLIVFMHAAKNRAVSRDNLNERFGKGQSGTRLLLRHAVSVMVSRLGPRFPGASMRGELNPMVQTVVVEQEIAGIESHDDYSELRGASLDAEVIFLTRLQVTLQKNLGSFRKDMRDLVVGFFEDNTLDPKINHIKFHVSGSPAGGPIMESDHPTMQACFALPFPWVKVHCSPLCQALFQTF
jgi:hypothetical protein